MDDLLAQTSGSKGSFAQEKRMKMFHGVCRDDYLTNYAADKKRMKLEKSRDGKKKETNAPMPDRIPMPNLPESVKMEYRASMKDAQQRKVDKWKIALKIRIELDFETNTILY